jgi:hypothetical protein
MLLFGNAPGGAIRLTRHIHGGVTIDVSHPSPWAAGGGLDVG